MINTKRRGSEWVICNPIDAEIARNTVSGMTELKGFGERDSVTYIAGGADVWRGPTATILMPNQSGGERMMLFSSNYDDRLNGTGINKIEIDYLNAAGNENYETVNLNGTRWVRTVGTNIRFVNAIHASQVGVGTIASGDISISANGTTSKVYNFISNGGNMSLSTLRMIPLGKTFYLHEWTASCVSRETNTIARLRLRATTIHGTRIMNVFLFSDSALLNNSVYNKNFYIPKKIPSLSILKVTAEVAGTAWMGASYSGSLENNNS